MLNGRAMLLGVLWVFFITSAVFGQQSDVASSPPTLSELQLAITKEIHTAEGKMRDHVDGSEKETRDYIDGKFSKLNDKFSELDKEVAVLNNAKWYITIIIAPISVYYSILLLQMFRKWNNDRKSISSSKDAHFPIEPDVDMDEFSDDSPTGYQTAKG